jgi:glycosyltransferase involved in cell wall biosynthesis
VYSLGEPVLGIRRWGGGKTGRGDSAEDRDLQIVFFSEIKWTYMRTRKQFLLSHLPQSWTVLFLEPFAFGRRNSFRPSRDGRVTYVTVPFLRGGTTSGLYNRVLNIGAARWLLSKFCLLWVRVLFAFLRVPSRRVFLVSNPYAWESALTPKHDLLCYDYNDNPFQFPQTPEWVRPGLNRLLGASDLVFVVSRHYLDKLAGQGVGNLHLLGNGVEFEHFATPAGTPPDLEGLPRPLLLYTGRLGPLLDFDLLSRVSLSVPKATLLLVGPLDPASRPDLESLLRRENVVRMDEKPYNDLPGYIQAADVCLAPFKFMHTYTVGVNPNKIYQYLAAGRPVVSSYFAELDAYAKELCLARDADEFIDGLERTLAGPPPAGSLSALARENDWKVKAEVMASTIEGSIRGRTGG